MPTKGRAPFLPKSLPATAAFRHAGLASCVTGCLACLAACLAGCGATAQANTAGAARRSPTPLRVVASAYPLAQLAAYVGGDDVQVADLAPPGAQPQGLRLSAAQRREIGQAGLLIEVGDGYQPQVEQVAAMRRLALLPALSAQPRPYEFWLDPSLAGRAASLVAKALAQADPAGSAQFQNGARDFKALVSSLDADYESGMSTCSGDRFVTSDDAFGRLAATYNLVEVAVSTSGSGAAATLVTKDRVPVVFSEVGVPTGPLDRVAQAAGVPVKSLDPLEVAPSPTAGRPPTYFDVMESDLTALEGGLACDTSSNYY